MNNASDERHRARVAAVFVANLLHLRCSRPGYFSINENRLRYQSSLCQLQQNPKEHRPCTLIDAAIKLAILPQKNGVRDASRCDAMRWDAMRRIRWLWSNGAVERKICGRKTSKRGLAGAVKSFRTVQGARGETSNVQISHGAALVLRPFIWPRNLFVNTRDLLARALHMGNFCWFYWRRAFD